MAILTLLLIGLFLSLFIAGILAGITWMWVTAGLILLGMVLYVLLWIRNNPLG
jgi:hypothetical protein